MPAGVWELHVLGKNGVTVHGTLHTPGSPPVVLNSQDNLQIADRSFHFLLPSQPQWCARSPPHSFALACLVHTSHQHGLVNGRPGDAQPATKAAVRQAAPRQSFELPQPGAAAQQPVSVAAAPAAAAGMPNLMANRAVAALPPAQQQAVVRSTTECYAHGKLYADLALCFVPAISWQHCRPCVRMCADAADPGHAGQHTAPGPACAVGARAVPFSLCGHICACWAIDMPADVGVLHAYSSSSSREARVTSWAPRQRCSFCSSSASSNCWLPCSSSKLGSNRQQQCPAAGSRRSQACRSSHPCSPGSDTFCGLRKLAACLH